MSKHLHITQSEGFDHPSLTLSVTCSQRHSPDTRGYVRLSELAEGAIARLPVAHGTDKLPSVVVELDSGPCSQTVDRDTLNAVRWSIEVCLDQIDEFDTSHGGQVSRATAAIRSLMHLLR